MSELVKRDEEFEKYLSSFMSPNIKRFVDGLDNGTASLDWALLSRLGFVQKDGSIFRILNTVRSYDEQCDLYKKGRVVSSVKEYEVGGKGYRYRILTTNDVSKDSIVTNAWGGESYHNYGLAVDIVLRSVGDVGEGVAVSHGGQTWSNLKALYEDIGLLKWACECGLVWGGEWKFYDCVHFEDESYKLPIKPTNLQCNFGYVSGQNVDSVDDLGSVDSDITSSSYKSNIGVLFFAFLAVLAGVFFWR